MMKSFRVWIVLAVVLVALAGVRFWPGRTPTGAATPEECVENYYESLKSADAEKYLHCLGEPYRTDAGRRFFDTACRDVRDVKALVQQPGPGENASPRWMDVEEVRAAGVRRLRYHLHHGENGWVIVAIDPPRETTSPVRYGTPVGDGP